MKTWVSIGLLQASTNRAAKSDNLSFYINRRDCWEWGKFIFSSATRFQNMPAVPLQHLHQRGFAYGTINASSLSATLHALSTHQNTRTLSNPRVVTLDNEKVTFNVGFNIRCRSIRLTRAPDSSKFQDILLHL